MKHATPFTMWPIGVIHTPFSRPEGAPIQGSLTGGHLGRVEVFEEFAAGLDDIEGFSHLVLLYAFHRSRGWDLRVRPFLDERERGLFATRAPRRPNPMGLTVVRLVRRVANVLEVEGVDMVDGTPLLDIKPHVPDFDCPPGARVGWLTDRIDRGRARADDRFTAESE